MKLQKVVRLVTTWRIQPVSPRPGSVVVLSAGLRFRLRNQNFSTRIQESEEERREVGCQWESPEEERREVGCQSDSAERRDAAVQVDLLNQQLSWRHTGVCGVAWRCVSVRADEPGGGALLQHCRTHHGPPLRHTQLPTMPLFQSPAPPETTSLPSMPLCEPLLLLPPADVSAPPSGLIAPLSPHLAEEVEVEVEGGVIDTEQVRRPRRKRVGPPIRYLLESEGQSHSLSVTNHSRGMTVIEKEEEKEEVDVDGVKPVKTADTEQAGRPRRKTVGPPIRYLLESEEQSHDLSVTNHSIARGAKVKMKPGRLRTEHQEEEERRGVELCQVCGLTFTCESSLQLHLSVHRAGSCITNASLLHHHHHNKQEVNTNSDGERMERRDEEELKTLLPVPTKASDWLRCRKRMRRNPWWWVDFCTTMRRRRQERVGVCGRKRRRCREEEEQEKGGGDGEEKVEEQPQRPRRTRVGPPIRYLLESEELSHGPVTANQDRAGGWREGRKQQKKISAEGGDSNDAAMIDTPEFKGQSGQTNQDRVNRLKESGGRPNKVGIECEAGDGASERHKTLLPASTKATDWLRRRELVRRNPQWWVDYRATMRRRRQDRDGAMGKKRSRCREEEEHEKGGGGGEEKVEQPQRPRRTRVGPPIRYLLESEELSHGPIMTNQGRPRGWREGKKPQKKINAEGGASERHKTLLPASTKATDWLRHRELVRRNPQWWVDCRATMKRRRQDRDGARGRKRRRCREQEEDTEVKEEIKEEKVKQVCLKEEGGGEEDKGGENEEEHPQRPRRTMVGPPIRYLLESEEMSHGTATAYQDRAGDFKEGRKPQKKSKVGGGALDDTAMIDRPEDTDRQVERQMGLTNQDRLDGPNERGGSPNKVMIHKEARGGASEMTDRATPVSDRQTGSYRRSYLVYINLQSSQVTVLSPCCVRLQRLPLIG
ncbi:uncharacterized protein AB9X84_025887 isoform 2-T2 [Acanthopagrus schlegelii]